MEALKSADAQQLPLYFPFGTRVQFWAAGQEEVMVARRPGSADWEAWLRHRDGPVALKAHLIRRRQT